MEDTDTGRARAINRVRVKICGITTPADGLVAARAGADAIGLVFYPDSPRLVDTDKANAVISVLPPFITKVGLFVDPAPEFVESVLNKVRLDMLQFHGNESRALCSRYAVPYIKAVRMHAGLDLHELAGNYSDAAGLLLDAYVPGQPGGTGRSFDWNLVPSDFKLPLILAGGLDKANVMAAIRAVRPYAVDVSGGVESARGIKDRDKIIEFIELVNSYE